MLDGINHATHLWSVVVFDAGVEFTQSQRIGRLALVFGVTDGAFYQRDPYFTEFGFLFSNFIFINLFIFLKFLAIYIQFFFQHT